MARERKFSTDDIFNETKKLLLEHGYEGYNIGQLAEKLNVSRAAIYKYYTNKDELIVDFMLHDMNEMMVAFNSIDQYTTFEEQLNSVLNTIFDSKDLHQILAFAHLINAKDNEIIANKLEKLNKLHLEMYKPLMGLIAKGKKEELIHQDLSDSVMISFIFQSIQIPNHTNEPNDKLLQSIRKLIVNGLYMHK